MTATSTSSGYPQPHPAANTTTPRRSTPTGVSTAASTPDNAEARQPRSATDHFPSVTLATATRALATRTSRTPGRQSWPDSNRGPRLEREGGVPTATIVTPLATTVTPPHACRARTPGRADPPTRPTPIAGAFNPTSHGTARASLHSVIPVHSASPDFAVLSSRRDRHVPRLDAQDLPQLTHPPTFPSRTPGPSPRSFDSAGVRSDPARAATARRLQREVEAPEDPAPPSVGACARTRFASH
jgi:hypothetical protein